MSSGLALPWQTDFISVFIAFVVTYVIIDVIFIRIIRLSAIAWRRVDYIWLSVALIGVLGTTASGRQEVASNLLTVETYRLESVKIFMTSLTTLYSSDSLCGSSAVRAKAALAEEAGPNIDMLSLQCSWFTQVHEHLQSTANSDMKIDLSTMLSIYPAGGDKDAHFRVIELLESYNTSIQTIGDLKRQMKSTDFETNVRLIGPLLIALALGLRMAKVTAEVKMDRQKLVNR